MRLLPFLAVALGVPAVAHATTFGTPTITIRKQTGDNEFNQLMNDMERTEFFSTTSCKCDSKFAINVTLPGASASNNDVVEFWAGTDCANTTTRGDRCVQLTTRKVSEFFQKTPDIPLGAAKVMFPPSGACSSKSGSSTIFMLIDDGGDGTYDHNFTLPIPFDTEAPSTPSTVTSEPVEDGINVTWDLPTSNTADIGWIQVLCASSIDGKPILVAPSADPEYTRPEDIACNPSSSTPDAGVPDAGASTIAPADAGPPDDDGGLPGEIDAGTTSAGDLAAFNALDPAFICASQTGSSEGKRVDLSDTENVRPFVTGEKIKTRVVFIDRARNYVSVSGQDSALPRPVRDGWEVYHDRGGDADGGFCFVATAAYGDYDHPYVRVLRAFRDGTLAPTGPGRAFIAWYYRHSPAWADFLRAHPVWRGLAAAGLFPVVCLAWLWNGIGLPGFLLLGALVVAWRGRRRRGRRRLASALAVTALLAAAARPASAQVYVEEGLPEPRGLPRSMWAFELKLGPYFPDIDGESGLTGKPYQETFGDGQSLLFQMELDRFFFHPAGELGLGASIGYMGNSAKAFMTDDAGNPTSMRSSDTTSFKMLPLSLSVVYRMTLLADRTVVPLVPYAKLGLSYYLWQITKGNGDLANINGDKARGGTLGFQATIGLSVRADAFDREAARSLENELGVEHAGFFGELTYANVSGLGMSNRLHLGDLTWAAGVNFEF